MISKAVILGGNGAVGSLFCAQLGPILNRLTVIDLQPLPDHGLANIDYICTDIRHPSQEARTALGAADLIILALPEELTVAIWPELIAGLQPAALVVDTLSIKNMIVEAARAHPPAGEYLSINPMFAPALGFEGQNIAVIEVVSGSRAQAFLELLKSWGSNLCLLSADEHDRRAAMLQAATHAAILAFGMTLKKQGYDLSSSLPIMPPPHRTLLALLARILSASPEVYWDIQAGNKYADESRIALAASIRELSSLINNNDLTGFKRTVEDLSTLFDKDQLGLFSQNCAKIFSFLKE